MLTQDEKQKAVVIQMLRPDFMVTEANFLTGGLSNRCMMLTTDEGRRFVWRPDGESVRVFGLSRDAEFDAQRIAATQGLAAAPVKRYSEGVLNPWVEGETLTSASTDTIASLLSRIHALPLLANDFDPFERADHYYQQLVAEAKTDSLTAVHRHFQQHRFISGLVLTTCHYDLGFYNLVREADGNFKVLDWEYAAFGDPAFDLVMASLANELPVEQLVDRYCQIKRIDNVNVWQAAAQRWLPVANYLAMLWYALGHQLYGDDIYHERYASYLADLKEQIAP